MALNRLKSKPSDNYENPKDIQEIKMAQENMGDFKLKTATNYKIPEHMRMNAEKKKIQLASLEVVVWEQIPWDCDCTCFGKQSIENQPPQKRLEREWRWGRNC